MCVSSLREDSTRVFARRSMGEDDLDSKADCTSIVEQLLGEVCVAVGETRWNRRTKSFPLELEICPQLGLDREQPAGRACDHFIIVQGVGPGNAM